MPWPDGNFDHVFVMWVLEHLSDPPPILRDALRAHAVYIADFLEPAVPLMAAELDLDEATLLAGVTHLRTLADRDDGALTHVTYRAHAARA